MISLVFVAALLAAAPAAAPVGTMTVAPMKADKAKPGPSDVVCRKEPVLGSRMKSRICMTQGEWDARQAQDRDDLNRAQTQVPQKAS